MRLLRSRGYLHLLKIFASAAPLPIAHNQIDTSYPPGGGELRPAFENPYLELRFAMSAL